MNETVPDNCPNPIRWEIDHGYSAKAMAKDWRCTQAYVYVLMRFENSPSMRRSAMMATTFGWSTFRVMEFWLRKVAKMKRAA